MVLVCLSLVAALVLGTAFGKVEITVTSDGVVRAVTGVRPIRARLNGAVVSVAASSGALVQVGTPIAVLDSTELEARHRRLEELVRGLRAKTDREQALSDELHEKRMKGLQSMEATLRARLDLKRQVLGDQGVRTQQLKNLQGVGAASLHEVFGAREASHRTREELFGMQERLATLNVEMADRQESHAQSSLTRHRALEEQETELREVEDLIRLAEIRSPEGGRLESLTLTPGQVVEQGAVIAQLVPLDALRTAIVFVPAEEANFVAAGQAALVEFPSLSVSEFGAAPATVTRVSSDVATPEEIVAALGPRPDSASRSMFRVELRLENSRLFDRMQPHLRSGTLVRARLQTRTRRVASMLFDVVHNWIYR
ncbi:MAG TPA: HlyD family efflux transporter periplasmic adaptor subunit [Polyangiaceae bacterium]|nr:HlyD family efflux transporter periplasmic adaptor subunit [Polyangiaceae bacterium]